MKTQAITILTALVLVIASCDDNESASPKPKDRLPLRTEQLGYKKVLAFDGDQRLSKITTFLTMLDDKVQKLVHEFSYHPDGKFRNCTSQGKLAYEYTYEGDKIARADEYTDEVLTRFFTYTYDNGGRIHEVTTWQDLPVHGVVPTIKSEYMLDANDNVVLLTLHYFNASKGEYELISRFEYSEYDNKKGVDQLFHPNAANPLARWSRNNPGKMVTINSTGLITMIEEYTYKYDSEGFVTSKTTTTTQVHNGQSGSYETTFFYK